MCETECLSINSTAGSSLSLCVRASTSLLHTLVFSDCALQRFWTTATPKGQTLGSSRPTSHSRVYGHRWEGQWAGKVGEGQWAGKVGEGSGHGT